jgi:glycogen(starch) synthase
VRILHLSWEYPPVVYGGLGRHVHALAEAQAALGHEVTVITQAGDGAADDECLNGVRIVRVMPVAPAPPDWHDGFLDWCFGFNTSVCMVAVSLVRDWRPDVLHVHDWLQAQSSVVMREVAGVPLVLTMHATESGRTAGLLGGPFSKGIDATEAWLVSEADRVIVCSEYMRAEVAGLFGREPGQMTVIPNGIRVADWTTTDAGKRAARRRYGRPLICYTGRLEPEKGVQTLIEAMPAVRRAVPDGRAVVIGTGTAESELRHSARRRRLADAVTFAGYVSDRDLRATLAASDVAVVPSLYEPFGFVALEAMALGTPLVAARTGGLAGIVADGHTGLLFPPGDRAGLAEAIVQVLQHPRAARTRAAAARAQVDEHYSWPGIAEATVDVYRDVVAEYAA